MSNLDENSKLWSKIKKIKGGNMEHKVTLIPGDGIGPSVVEEAVKVIEATGAEINWEVEEAGEKTMSEKGTPIGENVLESIQRNRVALKGPVTTPIASGFRSVNVSLRKSLSLFANVRPARSFQGTPGTPFKNVDIVIIRENTEGLYSGIEHFIDEDKTAAESIKVITKKASERIIRFAFEYAKKEERKKVTLVHKANILKLTDGLFLQIGKEISRDYPYIEFEDRIIDNMCMQLVKKPYLYDVIVTMNLYGDIISDLCAGLIGGLGLAPSANIGENLAVFEPVHGSAPKYKGKNKVNPCAAILSGAMMLNYLEEKEKGQIIYHAVEEVIKEGKCLTYDLLSPGEKPCGTGEMGDAIAKKVKELAR